MKRKYFLRLILWSIIIFVLCTLPQHDVDIDVPKIPHLDKIAHFGLFFFFAAFAYGWFIIGLQISKKKATIWALLLAAFYGGIIEILQQNFFHRTGDVIDWLADIFGAILGIISYPLMHKYRRHYLKFLAKFI